MIKVNRFSLLNELNKANALEDEDGVVSHPFFNTKTDIHEIEAEEYEPDYQVPGPMAVKILNSTADIMFAHGPVACAKTSTMVRKGFSICTNIKPDKNGMRRSYWLIVRETVPQLRTSTIPSFLEFMPRTIKARFSTMNNSTNTMKMKFPHPDNDGTVVDMTVVFMSMDGTTAEKSMRGQEPTLAWVNEASMVHPKVIEEVMSRLGRFPKNDKKIRMMLDTNSFDTEHPLFHMFYSQEGRDLLTESIDGDDVDLSENFIEIFKYPSGFSDEAENLHNLGGFGDDPDITYEQARKKGKQYYKKLKALRGKEWARINIDNEFGTVMSGSAIYAEYAPQLHIAELLVNPKHPIYIGVDGGKDACCVVCQEPSPGIINVIDEFRLPEVNGEKPGLITIVEHMYEYLAKKYPPDTYTWIKGGIDPGVKASETTTNIKFIHWFQAAFEKYGVAPVGTTFTNDPLQRATAVNKYLSQIVGGRPRLQLKKDTTTWLQRAMSVYSWDEDPYARKMKERLKPAKTIESHIAEALQYAVMRPQSETKRIIQNEEQNTIEERRKRPKIRDYKQRKFKR